ncbi:MAG: hypothetical protein Q8Q24_02380 [bacterium]|nr:hypothetical protein [bacterium]
MRKLLLLPFIASYIAFMLILALLAVLAALWFFGQGNALFGIIFLIISLFIFSKTFSLPKSYRAKGKGKKKKTNGEETVDIREEVKKE